ncbi:hypothetical protein [Ralstonia pickettii]|uniref:hypothetical protein n=1 Tax=Ralstonia pickettii TaxID=329 RepID=UPI0015FA9967|nr:hypothetical protein [Ralstonia pickettii]MBB0025514.1 hypothetical protein [Ralstonia pickettii]MBB0036142.1 hypothetical protein [Ralstonia pickettii]MBB0098842.1 hypothetical protein [Ralstonia pickettii]MBB0108801.1 hypothetical protein [Ralstonia pickettii]MBB0129616.1 hypothetical protein [Ralstonia pickettii]
MHAKRRNHRIQLYRSIYVRKGQQGNTHGYAEQQFVGSLPANATRLPAELATKLSDDEKQYVERVCLQPARDRLRAEQDAQAAHARDPNWRLEQAADLLRAASQLMTPQESLLKEQGKEAIARINALMQSNALLACKAGSASDPLQVALQAVQSAARALRDGAYGQAPAENVRATQPYQLWTQIKVAVDGSSGGSLLRALQERGFAKTKRG